MMSTKALNSESHLRRLVRRSFCLLASVLFCLSIATKVWAPAHPYDHNRLRTAVASFANNKSFRAESSDKSLPATLTRGEYSTENVEAEIDALQRALKLSRKNRDLREEARLLVGLGNIYVPLDENERAVELLNSALEISYQLADRKLIIETLFETARLYKELGNNQESIKRTQQALKMSRNGSDYTPQSLSNLAALYQHDNKRSSAIRSYRKALALSREGLDRASEVQILLAIATIEESEGNHDPALNLANKALNLARSIADRRSEAGASYLLARVKHRQGNLFGSLTDIKTALDIGESLGERIDSPVLKASFFASIRQYYEFCIDLLMQLDRLHPEQSFAAAAFQISERSRARSFYDQLAAKAAVTTHVGIAQSQQELPDLKEIQSELNRSDTLLLEYGLGAERSYLWMLSANSIESYELPARAVLEKTAEQMHELLTARQRPPYGNFETIAEADRQYWEKAATLAQLLLGPVAPKLGTRRLVIVGDGLLQYIPFEALPVPGSTDTARQPRPLIVDHEIISLPSASVLVSLRRRDRDREPATKLVAVLADPVFGEDDPRVRISEARLNSGIKTVTPNEENLKHQVRVTADGFIRDVAGRSAIGRLSASRREAKEIESLTSRRERLIALGFDANRELVMSNSLADYRILHIATHAFYDSKRPERSSILLSTVDERGRPENGFLQLRDIYNLDLSADIVVLSACQTALGRDVRGEGLVGFTRGFMYAGAQSVVASLWKVDDEATADLMGHFYKGMIEDGLPPAAALRRAQIELLQQKRWQAPYYWAAFTLQGDWERSFPSPSENATRIQRMCVLIVLFLGVGVVSYSFLQRMRNASKKLGPLRTE